MHSKAFKPDETSTWSHTVPVISPLLQTAFNWVSRLTRQRKIFSRNFNSNSRIWNLKACLTSSNSLHCPLHCLAIDKDSLFCYSVNSTHNKLINDCYFFFKSEIAMDGVNFPNALSSPHRIQVSVATATECEWMEIFRLSKSITVSEWKTLSSFSWKKKEKLISTHDSVIIISPRQYDKNSKSFRVAWVENFVLEIEFHPTPGKSSRLPRALANFSIIFNQLHRAEAIKNGILLNFARDE